MSNVLESEIKGSRRDIASRGSDLSNATRRD